MKFDGIQSSQQPNENQPSKPLLKKILENTKIQTVFDGYFDEQKPADTEPTIEEMAKQSKAEKDPTPEQKKAQHAMEKKKSSTGMTYKKAKETVDAIREGHPECNEEIVDDNTNGIMVYRTKKVFNPDKLPEPEKTQYKEAMASMYEIEQNNEDLQQQTGLKPTKELKTSKANTTYKIEGGRLVKEEVLTDTQKKAREALDEKVSSDGISYKDAKAKIEEIKNKYGNDPEYQSKFEQEQPTGIMAYIPVKIAFDPYKLPYEVKKEYFNALKAMKEIEQTNYALLVQAGLERTPTPPREMVIRDLL